MEVGNKQVNFTAIHSSTVWYTVLSYSVLYSDYARLFYSKTKNIYLHMISWVNNTRHISGFLSCPS